MKIINNLYINLISNWGMSYWIGVHLTEYILDIYSDKYI